MTFSFRPIKCFAHLISEKVKRQGHSEIVLQFRSETSFLGVSNKSHISTIKKTPLRRFLWSGREDDYAFASFTAAIGLADRRISIRLCLVVEPPSSEVQTLKSQSQQKKTP